MIHLMAPLRFISGASVGLVTLVLDEVAVGESEVFATLELGSWNLCIRVKPHLLCWYRAFILNAVF